MDSEATRETRNTAHCPTYTYCPSNRERAYHFYGPTCERDTCEASEPAGCPRARQPREHCWHHGAWPWCCGPRPFYYC